MNATLEQVSVAIWYYNIFNLKYINMFPVSLCPVVYLYVFCGILIAMRIPCRMKCPFSVSLRVKHYGIDVEYV